MSEKVITLPQADDMFRRLVQVNDSAHLRERFYPLLLEHAGTEKVPDGVTLMVMLAIAEYTGNLPVVVQSAMLVSAPRFIDALVDDAEVAAEAKQLFADAISGA